MKSAVDFPADFKIMYRDRRGRYSSSNEVVATAQAGRV